MYPHAAHAAFSHVIMRKWQFIVRTVVDVGKLFQPIEDALNENIISALTGRE